MTYLLVTAVIAFTVPGMVFAIRALPWVSRMVDAGIKPWVCDVCMSFWLTGGLALAAVMRDPTLILCAGPAYTLAMLVLSFMERPSPPPPMPPFVESGLAEKLEPAPGEP